jgi:DNA-binding Lrp family transcriptional regulator
MNAVLNKNAERFRKFNVVEELEVGKKENVKDKQEKRMKDVELRLISELLRNSRRSHRELSTAVGVSQPTVSRVLRNLEKGGFIRNYTILPDFGKLGYSLLAITFPPNPNWYKSG